MIQKINYKDFYINQRYILDETSEEYDLFWDTEEERCQEGVFVDEEARGGPGDGAVLFIEDLEHGDGFIYLAAFIPAEDAVDVFELGSVRNLIGKDLHIDLIIELDRNLTHAQRRLQGFLGLQISLVHVKIIRSRTIDTD